MFFRLDRVYVKDVHSVMLTIIESPLFSKHWPDYWSEEEHGAFMSFLANNPDAGAVVSGSGGCRKVRWMMDSRGKSGAVRIIYTAQLSCGALVLLTLYGKGATPTLSADVLRKIAKEFNYGSH